MQTFAPVRSTFHPAIPQNIKDLAIPESLVLGSGVAPDADRGVFEPGRYQPLAADLGAGGRHGFKHMRSQQLVEIKGMQGNDYNFTLSQAGKQLAGERFHGVAIRRGLSGIPQRLPCGDKGPVGEGPGGPSGVAAGVRGPDRERSRCWTSWVRRSCSADFDLRLRTHRQRQNQPGGAHAARLSGRDHDSLRGRGGQSDYQRVRPGGAPPGGKFRRRDRPSAGSCASGPASWLAAS